ncbi:MAG: malto-oligosyltrehalose synthase [Gammaproteobacteria bacterium]|nr:malto-oligosyltrehalose synthase [Gammaproteobacteria bacterium]MBU1489553.1 malto-oligosyltrehalose synthase [Gammaproteobacteria bacterium]MBU2067828.1 malto-oligosyltrehalose synthase [Gammaproteobacteria bacterium]MBU2141011.1 malto-oligosyltrehalose synthase [Gammaproteobacteria bacterium]MBU2217358.1 malto-oligosyltrehalose synthase [Gammaproteobacteria bacterium]
MTEVRATARLQFHKGFTLDDAVEWVDYFAGLGVSHLYASPLFKARPGSMHGYDVLDPTCINPELGGEAALERLVSALRARNMGLIIDIVSNHMAVGGDGNPWWLDVLEWGVASPYAAFFDIQWQSHDPLMRGQLLLPFLRTDYYEVLQAGEIVLHLDKPGGAFYCAHYEHRFPLSPPTYAELLRHCAQPELQGLAVRFAALDGTADAWHAARLLRGEFAELLRQSPMADAVLVAMASYRPVSPEGLQRLHQLLERQHYRLASWHTAADDINWRRFFDINELGGLRVERSDVFEATHVKIFELIERGLIDGLRIDHIDGLANPRAYCRKLRRRVNSLLTANGRPTDDFLIVVEKILGAGEQLPADWQVDGTTGYEFMNQVSLLQHAPEGEAPMAELWTALSERPADFMVEVRDARQWVLSTSLAGDLEAVAQGLLLIARADLATRDLTLGAIRRALQALIVHFPVYRTYAGACGRSPADQTVFTQALYGARSDLAEADWPLLQHLDRWLGGEPLRDVPAGKARHLRQTVLTRFQQLTSPAAAKAVEDTACYRSAVALARNDVGFDPQLFSAPVAEFHAFNQARAQHWPGNLLTTATHDHKRGEDTRARLAVLSERGDWFAEQARSWYDLAAPLRVELDDGVAPSAGDCLITFQALLGSWPLDLAVDDQSGIAAYAERLRQWQQKALREAKLRSTWNAPNERYEQACHDFLDGLLMSPEAAPLREALAAAVEVIAAPGALNSLAQTLQRLTAPGIPDLYQGCDYWDFSLVDPDNRRPVDYPARAASLASAEPTAQLLTHWRDGRIKQRLITAVLALRAEMPTLFAAGSYIPLQVRGAQADQVLAFARCHGEERLVVILPCRASALVDGQPHIPAERWGDTAVLLPPDWQANRYQGGIDADWQPLTDKTLPLSQVLAHLPVTVLRVTTTTQEPLP